MTHVEICLLLPCPTSAAWTPAPAATAHALTLPTGGAWELQALHLRQDKGCNLRDQWVQWSKCGPEEEFRGGDLKSFDKWFLTTWCASKTLHVDSFRGPM